MGHTGLTGTLVSVRTKRHSLRFVPRLSSVCKVTQDITLRREVRVFKSKREG